MDDVQEIAPWDEFQKLKSLKKLGKNKYQYKRKYTPWSGTMPITFQYDNPILFWIDTIFRSYGLFWFVSNPLLGIIGMINLGISNWWLLVGTLYAVTFGNLFTYYFLNIPKRVLRNGVFGYLYVLCGLMLSSLHQGYEAFFPLTIVVVLCSLLASALGRILVNEYSVSFQMFPALISVSIWTLSLHNSRGSLSASASASASVNNTNTSTTELLFPVYVAKGISNMAFSGEIFSIGLTVGWLMTSPIIAISTWLGSLIGTAAAYAVQTSLELLLIAFAGLNGAIVFTMTFGIFFVPSWKTFVLASIASFIAGLISISLGTSSTAWPASLTMAILQLIPWNTHSIIQVDLNSITVPEDHYRRHHLSQMILSKIGIVQKVMDKMKISPDSMTDLETLENIFLPCLMCSAAKHNKVKDIQKLLDNNANPDLFDYDHRTALHIAASHGHSEIIFLLLKSKATINIRDRYNDTPVDCAIHQEHYEIAKLLISHGGIWNNDSEMACQILCYQIVDRRMTDIQYLIDLGINANATDYDNRTPFHIATSGNHIDIVKLLLKKTEYLNIRDYNGKSAYDEAADRQLIEIMNLFSQYLNPGQYSNGGIDDKISIDREPIMTTNKPVVFDKKMITAIIECYEQHSLNNNENSVLSTVLCTLAGFEDETYAMQHIYQLWRKGFDISISDYDGRTALHIATSNNRFEMVKFLVKQGIELNTKDRWNKTPLYDACIHTNDDIVHFLINNGAILERIRELTLSSHIKKNDLEIVQLLLIAGHPPDIPDYDNRYPIDVAHSCQNNEAIVLLTQYIN